MTAAAKINPDIVIATVCGSDLLFGMTRMWEAYADELPWQTLTTRSLIEAKEWIKDRTGLEVIYPAAAGAELPTLTGPG